MASLLKARPDVELLLPRELIPGREVSATIVLRCSKEVTVDAITVRFTGHETVHKQQKEFLRLSAELGGQTLPEGETRLPFRFAIPEGNPPSFLSTLARIRYAASVHVDIPWWPDRRTQFTLHVAAPPRPSPADSPHRYSTRPAGPSGTEAHAELSLTSQWARPGDIISGAFALSNVAYNNYGAATLRLASTETLNFGFRSAAAGRSFTSRIEDTAQGEATMIPFRMRVPTTVTTGFGETRPRSAGLFSVKWEFVLEVEVRRGRNLVMRIPFEILPLDPEAKPRPYQAPPVVGSNRTGELWQSVGQTHGFEMKGDELHKTLGQTRAIVRREHQGNEGVFLLASFHFPSLGLGLEVERAGTLRRVVGGGITMGHKAFDAEYFVRARDDEQSRTSLEDAFCSQESALTTGDARLYTMDDETCVLSLADNGHSEEALGEILADANKALATLEELAAKVAPPTGTADTLDEWEFLRARLGAALSIGSLCVSGDQGSVHVEVATVFGKDGRPDATQLRVTPSTPLDVSPFELKVGFAEDLSSSFKGEVAQRLTAALSGGAYFRLDTERLLLEFGSPLGFPAETGPGLFGDAKDLDAASALLRVGHLVRVIGLLSGEAGPYR
ncbi:MAG: hypothetical protein ACI9KE_004209 [Polyangiales bacterium]|jgi:hypothetical protein